MTQEEVLLSLSAFRARDPEPTRHRESILKLPKGFKIRIGDYLYYLIGYSNCSYYPRLTNLGSGFFQCGEIMLIQHDSRIHNISSRYLY